MTLYLLLVESALVWATILILLKLLICKRIFLKGEINEIFVYGESMKITLLFLYTFEIVYSVLIIFEKIYH